jgi:hypothetical protein
MTVFSRIHLLAENTTTGTGKPSRDDPRIKDMLSAPTFVAQSDAIDLLKRADCGAAIKAMLYAGIMRLPYPKIVVEWCIRVGRCADIYPIDYHEDEPVHEFITLTEIQGADGGYRVDAQYSFLYTKSRIGGIFEDVFRIQPKQEGLDVELFRDIDPRVREIALGASIIGFNIAMVLMNMKGVDREIHRFDALNKKRAKKEKPAIPQYTYLRIGHVYRADGTAVKYTDGDHRKMPMHVRAAHTRRQHYGKENSETKLIYVPSCIVNFSPGEAMAPPKQRIIKA